MRATLAAVLLLGMQPAYAVQPNQPAPPFEALAQQHGKVVLVDFWASWCGPCRQAIPHYQALRQEFAAKGFEVIGVDVDQNLLDGAAALKSLQPGYPQAADPQGRIAAQYDLPGMPTAYLLDRRGTVRRVQVGFDQNDIEPLRQAVAQLVEEK
jgi:cytochrome c biogenesis protein CcmG, thiol:disulfide interchange protein DsbE